MVTASLFGIGGIDLPSQCRGAAIEDCGEVLADRWASPRPIPDSSCCLQYLLQQVTVSQSGSFVTARSIWGFENSRSVSSCRMVAESLLPSRNSSSNLAAQSAFFVIVNASFAVAVPSPIQ